MIDVSDLIGIPYLDHGRTLKGLDCYGVAIIVEERFGKILKDVWYDNHDEELVSQWAPLLNIRKIDFIKEGCLLEIRAKGTLHIAVALNEKLMVHATRRTGVRISQVAAYRITAMYEVL